MSTQCLFLFIFSGDQKVTEIIHTLHLVNICYGRLNETIKFINHFLAATHFRQLRQSTHHCQHRRRTVRKTATKLRSSAGASTPGPSICDRGVNLSSDSGTSRPLPTHPGVLVGPDPRQRQVWTKAFHAATKHGDFLIIYSTDDFITAHLYTFPPSSQAGAHRDLATH